MNYIILDQGPCTKQGKRNFRNRKPKTRNNNEKNRKRLPISI